MIRVFALLVLFWPSVSLAGNFRASVTRVDITPDSPQWLMGYNARQSTGVHDRIYHRIVALDDGTTQFYLVSSDLCLFSPEVYEDVTRILQREMGIEPRCLWWSVTHSHSTPEVGPPGMYKALLGRSDHEFNANYARQVTASLVEGVRQARATLEPARIAIGTGMSMANINRRAQEVNGHISLGLNPGGPTDRQIGLIRLDKADGSLLAVIANYAMHGTVLGPPNLLISGDAPGTVSAYVEQKLGAPVLYVNGAAGNLAPIYTVYPDPGSGHLSQFGVLLGDPIIRALSKMGPGSGDVRLWAGETHVETPRREGLSWPDELSAYTRTTADGTALVRLPVRVLRINNTLIWAAPVELFCELSNALRNRSPYTHTFFFGYTNGWLGYLPTADAFDEGGYETRITPFTRAVEQNLMETMVIYLDSMPR